MSESKPRPMTVGAVLADKIGVPPTKEVKTWVGDTTCDLCHHKCGEILIDGVEKTTRKWAVMCLPCFKTHGVGIGQGSGQKYQLVDGVYVKIEG